MHVPPPGHHFTLDQVASRCAAAFTRRFGSTPEHIAHAPGRINLIGEHVDYTGGLVLPMAIDRWTVVCIGRSEHEASCYRAEDLERDYPFDINQKIEKATEPELRPANHVLGVIESLRNKAGINPSLPQINLLASGNVPIGAGLSSSAALEVATIMACDALGGHSRSKLEIAGIAQKVEHDFVGTPCGIMDMLTSSAATGKHALLIDCHALTCSPIPLPSAPDLAIMVVDTGIHHELAYGEYTRRRTTCKRVEEILKCPLRLATEEMLEEAKVTDIEYRRALHVIRENARVRSAVIALKSGDLTRFGSLLFDGHESLKSLFDVTIPEVDLVVDAAAREPDGAVFGARMTGGGFGGSVIVMMRPEKIDSVRTRIDQIFKKEFHRSLRYFMVSAVDGAGLW